MKNFFSGLKQTPFSVAAGAIFSARLSGISISSYLINYHRKILPSTRFAARYNMHERNLNVKLGMYKFASRGRTSRCIYLVWVGVTKFKYSLIYLSASFITVPPLMGP